MPVTQRHLADQLGVSVTTVSRALKNDPAIKPETRGRVMEAAATLGYKPARTLNGAGEYGRQSNTVGVLVRYDGDHASSVHVQMLAGISEICECRGKLLTVHYARGTELKQLMTSSRPAMLDTKQVGGLILLGNFPDATVEWLAERWPCVVVHHYTPGTHADIVEIDAIDGFGHLVRKLHGLGHTRFGFIGSANPRHGFTHARHAAFFQALNSLGLDYDPAAFTRADSGAIAAVGDWLEDRMAGGVTAWVGDHDNLAAAVGDELIRRGYRIPDDVSLAGIDGIGTMANGRQISSVAIPFEALGSAAAHRLLRRLEYPQAPRPHILISGRIVEGDTIAAPPAAQREKNPSPPTTNQTDQADQTHQTDRTP